MLYKFFVIIISSIFLLNRETFEWGKKVWKSLWSKGPMNSLIKKFCHPSFCASLFNILWSVRTELYQSIVHGFCTQSTFHADWFSKGKFPEQWPFVFIKQMHLWIDTRRQLQILLSLFCATEGANQTINECHLFLLT